MVGSPEHCSRNRGTGRAIPLGRQSVEARAEYCPAELFLLRPAPHVRVTQWPDPRPERRLSLQRAYGAASVADARGATATARRNTRLDASATTRDSLYCTGRALAHPRADSLCNVQSHHRCVALAAVLQCGDGAS